jgi:hypothetical protein
MLRYKDHARKRMRERGISEEEVEICWRHHSLEYSDKKGNPIFIEYIKGRRIKVVVAKENYEIVITVAD